MASTATSVIDQILGGIGAPTNANNVQAMQEWFAAEGGSNNNWLNVSPEGQLASYKNVATGVAATIATLSQSNMAGIKAALVEGQSPQQIKSAVIASPWSEDHYAGTTYGGGSANTVLTSDVTTTSQNTGDGVTAGKTTFAAPIAGADISNFHGYDLSVFTGSNADFLGEAEQAILKFISDPALKAKVTSSSGNAEYGYSSFGLSVPQLNAVIITAALAPNGMFDENTLEGLVSDTSWYKSTDQNQRSYEAALVSDPSSAHNALQQAQDKVLATANQLGVNLTAAQLNQIANVYAAQSYTQTNILGSESGTGQEWLDQAVVDTVLNVKATGTVSPSGTQVAYDYAGGSTDLSNSENPSSFTGVLQSLYQGFLSAAQSYLLYNPDDPTKGMLSTQDLETAAENALKQYTGTGASGQISQFVNGQIASYTETLKQQASSLYPTLAPLIQQGTTPQSYIQPMTNYVGSITGMGQGQVNVLDPQWNWLISSPGANGVLGPVTQDQALQKITNPSFSWTDPNGQSMNYGKTNAALQMSNNFQQSILGAFGKGA